MSALETNPAAPGASAHAHPGEGVYVRIAVILAVLTAAEIATYPAEELLGGAVLPILMVLMVAKFYLVAAFFMHLRFDTRLFSWVFATGVAGAAAIYLAVLVSFELIF